MSAQMGRRLFQTLGSIVLVLLVAAVLSVILVPLFHRTEAPATALPSVLPPDTAGKERMRCIDRNTEALVRRLQVIAAAKEDLIFSSYSFCPDESGCDVLSALYDAAERGVHVRLIVDGLSTTNGLTKNRFFRALSAMDNVEIKIYNPLSLLKPWKVNYRMHDKYIVADGYLYMLGGRNTRNVSLGDYQKDRDDDRDILVYTPHPQPGHSVQAVMQYFSSVWNQPCSKTCPVRKTDAEAVPDIRQHYASLREKYPEAFVPVDWMAETIPVESITLLTNPVEDGNKAPILWDSLCALLHDGQNILVQTPYVICNRTMYADLEELNGGGRDIRLITNSPASGANLFGCADYLNQQKRILKTGCHLYEYRGEHSVHTKTVLIDERISVVGSFNFDMRSAYLDTEMMLVIDSPELNAHLRELDQVYMEHSLHLQPDGQKQGGEAWVDIPLPTGRRILLQLLRLLTYPVRHLM